MITLEKFKQTIPSNIEAKKWHDVLLPFLKKYEINTTNRIAAFLAQVGHESGDMKFTEENLNYSAQGLLKTFGRYFKSAEHAQQYARQPEKIANYVYDDRHPARVNKLGNVKDGDGWKFRGGGLKQLTGRFNYTAFGADIGMSADEAADYVRTPEGALESAGWFWKKHNLNAYADREDIVGMTKVINGGTIGLEHRLTRYRRNKEILSTIVEEQSEDLIKFGSTVPIVKQIQKKFGFAPDGIFGKNTKAAVQSWQRKNGFVPDGELTKEQVNKLINT